MDYERIEGPDGLEIRVRATTATVPARSAAATASRSPWSRSSTACVSPSRAPSMDRKAWSTRLTTFDREHEMAMSLDEFLVDYPVDRVAVDAHKQRMLDAIEEARREDAEQT